MSAELCIPQQEVLMGELSWIYEVKRRVSLFQIRKGERVTCVDGITEEMIDGKSLKE